MVKRMKRRGGTAYEKKQAELVGKTAKKKLASKSLKSNVKNYIADAETKMSRSASKTRERYRSKK